MFSTKKSIACYLQLAYFRSMRKNKIKYYPTTLEAVHLLVLYVFLPLKTCTFFKVRLSGNATVDSDHLFIFGLKQSYSEIREAAGIGCVEVRDGSFNGKRYIVGRQNR